MGIPVLKQTTLYRIEKGVPLSGHGGGRPRKYPFAEMEVGDSFRIDANEQQLRGAAYHYGDYNQKKFSVRREGSGWRCWRVS